MVALVDRDPLFGSFGPESESAVGDKVRGRGNNLAGEYALPKNPPTREVAVEDLVGQTDALEDETLTLPQTPQSSELAAGDNFFTGRMVLVDANVLLEGAAAGVGINEGLVRLCRGNLS